MRVEVAAPGVGVEQAWAWWTDFRPGGQDHAFARWAKPQRTVEEREDGSLLLTDTARVLGLRWLETEEVRLAKPRVRFDVRNNAGRFWGHYRFLPARDGCRIEAVWEQELRGRLRWLGPLGRLGARWFIAWDLRKHVEEMRRDLAGV